MCFFEALNLWLLLQMYGLIWMTDLRSKLSKLDLLTMLASALCHDLDHPGYNNIYQVTFQLLGAGHMIGPVAHFSISSESDTDQCQDRPGAPLQRHFPPGEPSLRCGFWHLV